jgi:hypothetical protein
LTVKAGDRLTPETVGIEGGNYLITVDTVSPERIVVTYNGMVTENPDGTIDLAAPQRGRCLIQIRHRMKLATATMDGGVKLSVTLERIEEA